VRRDLEAFVKTGRLVGRFASRRPNPGRAAAAARLVTYARYLALDAPTLALHADPDTAQQVKAWLLRFARQLERVSA